MESENLRFLRARRRFLQDFAGGLGTIGLWQLLATNALPAQPSTSFGLRKPDFKATAKNVIFVFTEGGPSQLDLFDPKPEMKKWNVDEEVEWPITSGIDDSRPETGVHQAYC